MARGETFPIGHERVAQNGYCYVKTEQGWRLKHHLIAEEKLGRAIDTKLELVKFADHDRTNFAPDNIVVEPKKMPNKTARIAVLKARRDELQAQIEDLEEELSVEVG